MKLNIKQNVYKVGINEIEGLTDAMTKALIPIQNLVKERVYWNDAEICQTEYIGRDGFIPYSHNHGGVEISLVIPKCESYEFDFLEFGECDECDGEKQCGYKKQECGSESEGHLDAKLRIWLKFEGIDNNEMHFYLYLGGGNGDAPYFRTKHEKTIFETEFTAKTISSFKLEAKKQVEKLLKRIE
jgi:hypothetical protein